MTIRETFIKELNEISPELAKWANDAMTNGATIEDIKIRFRAAARVAGRWN